MPTHQCNNLSIDFVIMLLIFANWKGENYDSIFNIIDWLLKIVYYQLVKVIVDTIVSAIVIIDVVLAYHDLPDFILIN